MLKFSLSFRISVDKVLLLLAIVSPAYSVIIDCTFQQNTTWVVLGEVYTCNVQSIENADVGEVTEIIGDHVVGLTLLDVLGFSTNGRNIFATFPRNLETFFPNLIGLGIWGGELSSLTAEDLAPWTNLTELYFSENRLTNLDANLFQNAPRLAHITLRDNLIANVGVGLLSNLPELGYINFNNNTCIDTFAYTPEAIDDVRAELLENCPPIDGSDTSTISSTVDSDQCSAERQAERIENLQAAVREIADNPCSC